ncbi:trimeric intracellular cation channel family protein [Aggregicoccus sp. 17bor-14]|uniref:trimeric intracellular cation channel family protein n=1 Tax=Myxococcaceae TaxID=31 RepID=UPI00129C4344|nr:MULTISPECIES: trimeric intracellular cation channel family protein [Myxococcaceae]MBF5046052.1 trimeric intracellular cation channel family protein [Simulacricoccus sp. 17bor-14]MRI91782.1 trimeric intracellular cation channel family protein [Aggregicoccus sp. 17bor-14]
MVDVADEVTRVIPGFLRALDLLGVLANALLGGVVARQHRFDAVGFGTLAFLSGLGGGVIRDVLLQQGPPVALTDPAYLATVLGGAVVAFLIPIDGRLWQRLFPLADALGLGCWAAAGTEKTLLVGLGWLPAVLLGTVSAVGGGAVRDVVLRRVPAVFGGNTLYATCALAASSLLVLLRACGVTRGGPLVSTVFGAALYLVARWRGWTLPAELSIGRTRRNGPGEE